jgi:hypothetical protein
MANQFVKLFREVLDGTGVVVTPAYEEVTLEAPTWGSVSTTGDYYLNGQWHPRSGAELSINGEFTTDVTSWTTNNANSTLSWEAGMAVLTDTIADAYANFGQDFTFEVGVEYTILLNKATSTGTNSYLVIDNVTYLYATNGSNATNQIYKFIPELTTYRLGITNGSGTNYTAKFGSISVFKSQPTIGTPYVPQFTYLSKDGKLAEVETVDGVPVDVHYDKLAPDLVRHTIQAENLVVTEEATIKGGDIYHEANILGTVSQTAGVPTGAIIESGSNTNGSYVKYADGSITCWTGPEWTTEFVSDNGAAVPWTFPVVFISAPTVVGNCATRIAPAPAVESVAFGVSGVYEASTTSVLVYHTTNRPTPMAFGSTLQAIGRWF